MQDSAYIALVQRLRRSNMNKKQLIEGVAKKIGWDKDQTKTAITKYSNSGTIFNVAKVLSLCLESNSPEERLDNFIKYTKKYVKSSKKQFVDIIEELFLVDPSMHVICLFNIMDKQKKGFKFVFVDVQDQYENYVKGTKLSPVIYKDRPKSFNSFKYISTPHIRPDHIYYDGYSLSCEVIGELISEAAKKNKDTSNESYFNTYSELFNSLIRRVGFPIFNITTFRQHGTALWYSHNRNFIFRDILGAIEEEFLSAAQTTNKKYWLIYILVSIFKDNGLAPKDAYKQVEGLIGDGSSTVRRRYFQMKKEAEKYDYSLNEIIKKYHLRPIIEKYVTDPA